MSRAGPSVVIAAIAALAACSAAPAPGSCRSAAACDDGVACTADTCTGGRCAHPIDPARCAGGEWCDPGAGCVPAPACAMGGPACPSLGPCVEVACTIGASDGRCFARPGGDADGDGEIASACGGTDCDDARSDVSTRSVERCDGLDDDCDGRVDEGFDLALDRANCGACGASCDGVCEAGRCRVGACATPDAGSGDAGAAGPSACWPRFASCARPGGECARDSDCRERPRGRCTRLADGSCGCGYDECDVHDDCPESAHCACGRVSESERYELNRCVPDEPRRPGGCARDADCGEGCSCAHSQAQPGYLDCAPSSEPLGWFCHTPDDECRVDGDCLSRPGGGRSCYFDLTSARWKCGGFCSG